MKQITLTARNLSIFWDEKQEAITPSVECIFVLSEPEYEMTFEGARKIFTAETVRFMASPFGLRDMAKSFMEWADEAETQVKKMTSENNSADQLTQ